MTEQDIFQFFTSITTIASIMGVSLGYLVAFFGNDQ